MKTVRVSFSYTTDASEHFGIPDDLYNRLKADSENEEALKELRAIISEDFGECTDAEVTKFM